MCFLADSGTRDTLSSSLFSSFHQCKPRCWGRLPDLWCCWPKSSQVSAVAAKLMCPLPRQCASALTFGVSHLGLPWFLRLSMENITSSTTGILWFMRVHRPVYSSVPKDLSALVAVVDQTGGGFYGSFCSFSEPQCDGRGVLPPFQHVRSSYINQELE